MKWFLATVLLIAGLVWCQDDVLKNLQDLDDLQDNTELQEKSKDIENVIKDKCVKAGGEAAFNELQIEKEAVTTCFQNMIDMEQIQGELEVAKKTGSMDEVFAKYCKKKPEFLSCFNNFTNKLDKCLLESEKNTLKIAVNLTETLIDFACFKDGDRLAMFIAEGGQECLTEKRDGLQDCFNKSMKNILPSDVSLQNLPLLVIGETECKEFTNLQYCFVKELEACKDKTPANLMEALFKFIRKSLPCSTERQALEASDGPHYPPPTVKYTQFSRTTPRSWPVSPSPRIYPRANHVQQSMPKIIYTAPQSMPKIIYTAPQSMPEVVYPTHQSRPTLYNNTQQSKSRSMPKNSQLESVLLQKKIALIDLEITMAKERRQQNEKEHLLKMNVLQLELEEFKMRVQLTNYTLHVANNAAARTNYN